MVIAPQCHFAFLTFPGLKTSKHYLPLITFDCILHPPVSPVFFLSDYMLHTGMFPKNPKYTRYRVDDFVHHCSKDGFVGPPFLLVEKYCPKWTFDIAIDKHHTLDIFHRSLIYQSIYQDYQDVIHFRNISKNIRQARQEFARLTKFLVLFDHPTAEQRQVQQIMSWVQRCPKNV